MSDNFSAKNYLRDRAVEIIMFLIMIMIIGCFCRAFGLSFELICFIIVPIITALLGSFGWDYCRKRHFYRITVLAP